MKNCIIPKNKKGRNKHYPAETKTDADNTDDLALHANIPEPNSPCIVWSKLLEAFAFMRTQI